MDKEGPLKDIVQKVISDLKGKEKEELDILKTWEKAVGKKASGHTKLVSLRAKKLVVNVSNSSWLYKLTLEKKKLIQKFNTNLKGKRKIKEVWFRIGQVNNVSR